MHLLFKEVLRWIFSSSLLNQFTKEVNQKFSFHIKVLTIENYVA